MSLELYEYPIKIADNLYRCCVCDCTIDWQEQYYEGGPGRRCHVRCAPPIRPDHLELIKKHKKNTPSE